MFEINDISNIVSAVYHELEWEDQENLSDAYENYQKLTPAQQSQFDSLINTAIQKCKKNFKEYPDRHQTDLDMEIRDMVEYEIEKKLADIFNEFISE